MDKFISMPLIKPETIQARSYQSSIAESVLEKGNTLIVAPTALGKTIVAVLLAAQLLAKNSNEKFILLAPTRPLAVQHQKSFRKFLDLPEEEIQLLTGMIRPKERVKIFENAKIICSTPQVIENDIKNKRISLTKTQAIIFDEAHRAVKDYSYVFIAKKFKQKNQNGLIVGMTASPGHEEDKIKDICSNLSIKNIEVKRHDDFDVKPYVNEIEIEWEKVLLPKEFLEISELLKAFMQQKLNELMQLGQVKTVNLNYYSRKRLLELQGRIAGNLKRFGKSQPSLFAAISKSASLLKVSHALALLETQGMWALEEYFDKLIDGKTKADKSIISDLRIMKAISLTAKLANKGIIHPKVDVLKDLIELELKKNPSGRILVFNHYRDSVKTLVKELNNVKNVKATPFIGQATKGSLKGMNQKQQIETIEDFKKGKFNVLCATSVAEEGLDIPVCDLVVFYEPIPSEIRHIQRIGRTGRLSKGKAIILMAKNTRDEGFYFVAKNKQEKMHSNLKTIQKEGLKLDSQMTLDSFKEIDGEKSKKKVKKIVKERMLKKKNEKKLMKKIIVYIDNRERSSLVKEKLEQLSVDVREMQLEVGDYVISDKVVIERKTISDFLSSMVDGRLFNQLMKMASDYDYPLLLLEGNPQELFNLRNIHYNAIVGALTSIALEYRIPILFTKDNEETSQFVYVIAKRVAKGKEQDIKLRIGKPRMTVEEQQRFVVESLPMIGPRTAKNLLKEFGSINGLFNATSKELEKTENVGKKKAKLIRKLIDAKFKEKS